jgi:hypothetical protein
MAMLQLNNCAPVCAPCQNCDCEWVEKPITAVFKVEWNWTAWLLQIGECCIIASSWGLYDDANVVINPLEMEMSLDHIDPYGNKTRVNLSGGITGKDYRLYNRIRTAPGSVEHQQVFCVSVNKC